MMRLWTACVPVVPLAVAASCPAGEVLLELNYRLDTPDLSVNAFGTTLAGLGSDVDGDGAPDFVVGCWNGGLFNGNVLITGRTGQALAVIRSVAFIGFTVTGAGDLTGDGIADWATGGFYPYGPPQFADSGMLAYSGTLRGTFDQGPTGGPELYGHLGGFGLAGGQGRVVASDLRDGDTPVGTAYFLAGAVPIVQAEIFHHDPNGNFDFGWAVANVGDYNDDGIDDYAITQPTFNRFFLVSGAVQTSGPVHVETLGPEDLLLVLTPSWPPRYPYFVDEIVVNVGDLIGDGTADLAIGDGRLLFNLTRDEAGRLVAAPLVLLWPDGWSHSIVSAGDMNGDGVRDIALGNAQPAPDHPGTLRFFSGATYEEIARIDAQDPTREFGASLASIGDVENDGRVNLAVGARGAGPTGRGEVFVYNAGWITRQADFDFDHDVDLADFLIFQRCFTGSNNGYGRECRICDLDNDGDVDLADFIIFQQRFTGSL